MVKAIARVPRIYVLAGVNGAGKSSVGGAAVRACGAQYYNPDEAARVAKQTNPALTQSEANALAWHTGRAMLERSIEERTDFAFETTLGANTLTELLIQAARSGFEVHVWYAGLESPEQHIERVRARVKRGGHDIPEADIRRRFEHSRLNLIRLLPHLASLRVLDNSTEGDPEAGTAPRPILLLYFEAGVVMSKASALAKTPDWAKPIVAAALKQKR